VIGGLANFLSLGRLWDLPHCQDGSETSQYVLTTCLAEHSQRLLQKMQTKGRGKIMNIRYINVLTTAEMTKY
jgi:hypothetical protein